MECVCYKLGEGDGRPVGSLLLGTRQEIQVRKCNNKWDDK